MTRGGYHRFCCSRRKVGAAIGTVLISSTTGYHDWPTRACFQHVPNLSCKGAAVERFLLCLVSSLVASQSLFAVADDMAVPNVILGVHGGTGRAKKDMTPEHEKLL